MRTGNNFKEIFDQLKKTHQSIVIPSSMVRMVPVWFVSTKLIIQYIVQTNKIQLDCKLN